MYSIRTAFVQLCTSDGVIRTCASCKRSWCSNNLFRFTVHGCSPSGLSGMGFVPQLTGVVEPCLFLTRSGLEHKSDPNTSLNTGILFKINICFSLPVAHFLWNGLDPDHFWMDLDHSTEYANHPCRCWNWPPGTGRSSPTARLWDR